MTAHDVNAPAGAPCDGCGPADLTRPMRAYLIVAARNTAGVASCGHFHAEHATDSAEDMESIAAALGARHAAVEVVAWHPEMGRFEPYRAIDRGDHRADSAPCCAPIVGAEFLDFESATNPNGARCFYCGDLRARWGWTAPTCADCGHTAHPGPFCATCDELAGVGQYAPCQTVAPDMAPSGGAEGYATV